MLGCSVISDSVTPWTVAHEAPLSMETLQTRILEWVPLQGIFPTQELNTGLLYCRQILYCLSHQGISGKPEWVAIPFSRRSSTQGPNPGLLHCGQILNHLSLTFISTLFICLSVCLLCWVFVATSRLYSCGTWASH